MSEPTDERIDELIGRALQVEDPQMTESDDQESRQWQELAGLLGAEGREERARMSAALEAVLPGDAAERIAAGLLAIRS